MSGRPWNARFFEADPRFWPITPAALRFATHEDFPAPEGPVRNWNEFGSSAKLTSRSTSGPRL